MSKEKTFPTIGALNTVAGALANEPNYRNLTVTQVRKWFPDLDVIINDEVMEVLQELVLIRADHQE